MSREFETIRTEWPAIFKFDGTYFEEEYAIDTAEQRFREVSEEYVERQRSRKRRMSNEYPDGANPDTCLHRVLYPIVEHPVTETSAKLILCGSCDSTISPEYWLEHTYTYEPDHGVWVEVRTTKKPPIRERIERQRELNKLRDSRVERPQARGDSQD